MTDDGRQLTFAPKEFEEQYGWQNDPSKVRLTADVPEDDKEQAGDEPSTDDQDSEDNN
jgi:hypothetical protein